MPCTDNSVPMNQILCGDNLKLIQQLPDCSIQLVITSPPYFQQRNYGSGMGNEENVNDYIETLLCLFRECVRVLTDDGNIVFNIGDKYQNSNLLLVPYRFALAAMDTSGVRLVMKLHGSKGIQRRVSSAAASSVVLNRSSILPSQTAISTIQKLS